MGQKPSLLSHYLLIGTEPHGSAQDGVGLDGWADGFQHLEPGPGCNEQWFLSSKGHHEPRLDLTRRQRHPVIMTRDMLGLNTAGLMEERKDAFMAALLICTDDPDDLNDFLANKLFRAILLKSLS